jgi:hypothetical protein
MQLNMDYKENDPDTLQFLDELDTDWVKLWLRAANKKSAANELPFNIILPKKAIHPSARFQFRKTR